MLKDGSLLPAPFLDLSALVLSPADGGGCDPNGNAQNGLSNLGKMLRLDVASLPYTIPAGNPFAGTAGVNDEIWALGLRNPYRFAFDSLTGDLHIGDVGQNIWEEIDFQPASSTGGENYGWYIYEATHCPNPSCLTSGPCASVVNPVPPVLEYSHADNHCSLSGGFVYRGCRLLDSLPCP